MNHFCKYEEYFITLECTAICNRPANNFFDRMDGSSAEALCKRHGGWRAKNQDWKSITEDEYLTQNVMEL